MSTETEIQSEIEVLRGRFADTKALYREVCALLFFRYGITPTASKLYQYVRKGSMSAPADALAKFWEELRSKARVEIDHPDLPDEVKTVAAEAIQTLWGHATERARAELAASRLEMQAEVQRAQASEDDAKRQVEEAAAGIAYVQKQLAAASDDARQARSELETERRAHAGTAARCQELQRQATELQAQAVTVRAGFAAELARGRVAVVAANERSDAAERRALLEIDQERQVRARADKLVDSLRSQLNVAEARLRERELGHANLASRLQADLDRAQETGRQLTALDERRTGELQASREANAAAQREVIQYRTEAQTLRGLLDERKSTTAKPLRSRSAPATRKAG